MSSLLFFACNVGKKPELFFSDLIMIISKSEIAEVDEAHRNIIQVDENQVQLAFTFF